MTPSHFLANILHPMYKGKNLTPGQISIAQEMLLESYPELVSELLGLMSDSVKLPKALQHDLTLSKIKPVVWWLCIERSETVDKTLFQLAQKLLEMPSSSAAIERIFSDFGMIQSKLRNRLGLVKAGKLVFCYRMLRGKDKIDW